MSREYTWISARFAAPDNHCVVAETVEAAAIMVSPVDTPAEWLSLWSSGVIIEPFEQGDGA